MVKIVHLVTLVDEQGSFGGPVSVARVQTQKLAELGHEVVLIAGWDGRAAPSESNAVREVMLRTRSVAPRQRLAGLLPRGLWKRSRQEFKGADIVHIHLARDLTTMLGALAAVTTRSKLVLQTHGMIVPDARVRSRVVDALLIKRLLRANTVITLNRAEDAALKELVGPGLSPWRVANGVEIPPAHPRGPHPRPRVVFLSRLHPRKNVEAFCDTVSVLAQRGCRYEYLIAGADQGDLHRVNAFLTTGASGAQDTTYVGALNHTAALAFLDEADVLVLPSHNEPFPMVVLEALARGVAVVVQEGGGIAHLLSDGPCRSVVDDPELYATAVEELLSQDVDVRRASARALALNEFSIDSKVNRLMAAYSGAQGR